MARKFFYVCAGMLMLALAYHFGAGRAGAVSIPAEVAVLTGTVPDGGTIPLPHYADGTQALESECKWIASVHTATMTQFFGVTCYTTGRVVTVAASGACPCPTATANYMIIATRTVAPVPTTRSTFGEVKAHYR